jgi:CRP/FNR family cyclic AMP-dependent transcriptional regulator
MEPEPAPASLPLAGGELWLARLRRVIPSWLRRHPRGAILTPQGHALDAVHVVVSGVLSRTVRSTMGKPAVLALLGPGAIAGEEAAFGQPVPGPPPRTVPCADSFDLPEIRAVTPSVTLVVPGAELARALKRDPWLAAWLISALMARVRALERALARTLALPVRERLFDVLCELAEWHGGPTEDGARFPIPLCQEDLGALVGATRESVNRALHQLTASGLIERRGGSYVVQTGTRDERTGPLKDREIEMEGRP